MEHLLFAGYLVLFAWLVTKIDFFKRSGLTAAQLVIFFLLKVMAGIFYGWIGVYYGELAQMVDTWAYHYESLQEYQLLINDPFLFFSNLFSSSYESGYSGFLTSENSWWNDLKGNFLLKILAFFNVFSFGNYYINVVFYSFISFFGPVAVYRVMKTIFAQNKAAVLLATFLIPSFLYWTSGIHKEGLLFLGLALILFHFYFGFAEKKFRWQRLLQLFLGFLLVLVLRNFLIIVLLPALLAWLLAHKIKYKQGLVFIMVYGAFLLFFFTAKHLHRALDFPTAVVEKQQDFLGLQGGSAVNVDLLEPSFKGFLANAPQAFSLSILRPYPTDVRHLLSLAAAIEIGFLILLILIFLLFPQKPIQLIPAILFSLFLSFSVLMMIGYTVNFVGAIVRYRSIVLPLLFIPIVANTAWEKIISPLKNTLK